MISTVKDAKRVLRENGINGRQVSVRAGWDGVAVEVEIKTPGIRRDVVGALIRNANIRISQSIGIAREIYCDRIEPIHEWIKALPDNGAGYPVPEEHCDAGFELCVSQNHMTTLWRGQDADGNDVMTCAMCSSPIDVANEIARIAAEHNSL